jgi:hypothetical protein
MNKNLYKIFLSIVKYIPLILSICFIINLILRYFRIASPIIAYFGGASFLFIVVLYLISFVFKFCYLYRIPLHYITINNIFGIIYKCGIITFSIINMYRLYFILTGIVLIVYIWLMYKNRNNPKVDPIKQLCDTYCDCNC